MKSALYRCSLFILLFSISKLAYATFPDISGTYSGTLNGVDNSVSTPGCGGDGPFSGSLTVTLVGGTNGVISGDSGTFVDSGDGDADGLSNITGSNDDTTFVLFFDTPESTGEISGTFTANTLTITGGFTNPDPENCESINLNGTLNKVGGDTVVSENTASSTVTDAVLFNIQIQNTVSDISSRVSGALSSVRAVLTPRFANNQFNLDGALGLNAGDGISVPYGVWGNYSYTDYENDLSTTAFDGSSHSFLGGIDFQVWENTVMGVAFGYDNSDIDTGFNNGNQDTDTITIAPYFGAIISDVLSMDFNIGYSYVDYDQFRTAGATRVTSSPDADRWFGAFNLNAITFIDRWVIGGRVGMLYASSTIDPYTESDGTVITKTRTKVSTVSIAGDLAYSFNEWEPFVNLAYNYDFSLQEVSSVTPPQPSNDDDDLLFSAGVRYFEKSGISGNLEYSKRFLRDDFDEDRISLTVRLDY